MKRIALAVLLAATCAASSAIAQSGPQDGGGPGPQNQHGGRGQQGGGEGHRQQGGGQGGDRGDRGGQGGRQGWGNNGWRGGAPHGWSRGENIHQYYRGPTYVINNYGHYNLRRPPYGYHWIRDNSGNFLMVAIASGVIADLLLH